MRNLLTLLMVILLMEKSDARSRYSHDGFRHNSIHRSSHRDMGSREDRPRHHESYGGFVVQNPLNFPCMNGSYLLDKYLRSNPVTYEWCVTVVQGE